MYVPGLHLLVLYLLFTLALLVALAAKTPLPPTLLAAVLGGYFAYLKRRELLEVIYGERCLLLLRLSEVKVKKDYIALKMKSKVIISAFLKIENVDFPESDAKLGETTSRFISSLFLPSATVNVISLGQGGQRSYYLKVNFLVDMIHLSSLLVNLSAVLRELQRRLLSLGVRAEPADPSEVLPSLVEVATRRYSPTPPLVTLATAALVLLLAAVNPHLLPLALVGLPLVPLELRLSRGGEVPLRFKPLSPVSYAINEIPDHFGAASQVRSFAGALVWSDDVFVALLVPEDLALFSAKARKAMEVLEAGRVGVGKLEDEFKAMNVVSMKQALEAGAKPFRVAFLVGGEPWRYEPLGLERVASLPALVRGSSYLAAAGVVLGLAPSASVVKISPQLAWLAPHSFLRPRTRRTPRAVYLGRGLRRDEEVWLELDLLENVHGLIVGPMGSGKSTTARTLALRALERGIVPIIVDPSGEYRPFARRAGFEVVDLWDRPFNPLRASPFDIERSLSHVAPLSEYEAHLLRSHLGEAPRSLGELIEACRGTSLAWKLERLQPYFSGEGTRVDELLAARRAFVLCMGSTSSGRYVAMPVEVQRTAFELLLAQLRDYVVAQGLSEPRWMLIVDEGHLFMVPPPGFSEPLVVTMARMLRKFGLAVVVLTHEWGDVPEQFRRAAGWKLALAHSDPDYVSMTRVYMALTTSELAWFQAGVRGRAILRRGHEPYNILVEIEPAAAAIAPGSD